jgi:tRNA(Ile)-lysidine synthase
MLDSFLSYIQKEKLFQSTEKILLTVSGGVDSIAMCELFNKAKINFAIAHCNFQLRDKESDGDELFVQQLAKKYNVSFFCKRFNTATYANKKKISIQMAARELRYEWFEEIRKNGKINYIATAHHQDDSIETFFTNIVRGTGISGLHGILQKQGNIIRPLLFTNKIEIEQFVKENKLKYREDSSNASDKYMRNKIRHHIIPVLKELNPSLESSINNGIEHLRDVEIIYKNDIESKRSKIVKKEKDTIVISIKHLQKLNPLSTYLYEFLKPYGFNSSITHEIIDALDGESGKQFFSSTHRLIKDREFLIILKRIKNRESRQKIQDTRHKTQDARKAAQVTKNVVKKAMKEILLDTIKLKFSIVKYQSEIPKASSIACLDFDKLEFPLELRKWQHGDIFYPLGLKGKKKMSDYFIDKKVSLNQKENTWLLTSNGNIVWVIGQRLDERFKVTDKTLKIYFVELV